ISSTATFDLNGNTLVFGSGATLSNSGILKLRGGETITNLPAGVIGGTVQYYGIGANNTFTGLKAGNSYTNLSFATSGGFASVWTLNAALNVAATLSISASDTLDLAGNNLTGPVITFTNSGTLKLKGNETVNLPVAVIGGTVQYYGIGANNTFTGLKAGNSYTNLSFATSGGFASVWTLNAALNVAATLSISASDTLDLAGNNLTGPVITFTNSGTLKLKGNETVNLPVAVIGGTVQYYGIGANNTFTGLKAGNSYTNLSFATSGGFASVWTLNAALNVAATLSISASDTLDLAGNNLTGPVITFTNSGTLKLKGNETVNLPVAVIGGTVLYYGIGANNTFTGLKAGNSYTNLSFATSGGFASVWTLNAALSVASALSISSAD